MVWVNSGIECRLSKAKSYISSQQPPDSQAAFALESKYLRLSLSYGLNKMDAF